MDKDISSQRAVLQINDVIMDFDPCIPVDTQPKVHTGLNPILLSMRQEIYSLQKLTAKNRKIKLQQLLIEDYLQEDKELRQVGLAYTNTQN